MKKIVIIIISIIALLIIAGAGVFMFLNKEKESITAREFKNIMEDKGYTIVNAKEQFAEMDYIEKVYLALEYEEYQIEFYETSDDAGAIYLYNYNKALAEGQKKGTSVGTTLQGKNYSEYTLTMDGKYKYISRINNTMVYLNVEEEYKDEVKEIIKELGY